MSSPTRSLCAAHPLLATAAIARSKASERRALHLELAEVAANQELQARHLALGNTRPDERLAASIAEASRAASAHGAWQAAAELGEHALRLTPADAAERPKRAFYVGIALAVAGEKERFRKLLVPELELLPPGPDRARLWLLMPVVVERSAWPAFEHCQALLAAGRGLAAEAKRWAVEERAQASALGVPFHQLEAERVIGLAELLDHQPAQAAEMLRGVWEHMEREGVEEPGLFPVAPDLARRSSSWVSSMKHGP